MYHSTRSTTALQARHRRWLWIGLGVAAAHLLLLCAMQAAPSDAIRPQGNEADIVPVTLLAPTTLAADGAAAGNKPARPARPAAKSLPRATPATTTPAPATDASSVAASYEPASAPAPAAAAEAKTEPAPELQEAQPAADKEVDAKLPVALHAPAPARLFYEVTGQSKGLRYSANAMLDWRQDGQNYRAMMEISAFLVGSRSQSSSGLLGPEGLKPERFVDRARHERETRFDHEAGLVRHGAGGTDLPMPAGAQDKLSVFLQLAVRLGQLAKQPEPGDNWTVPVAASRAIENWTFDWRGTEVLDLPAGELLTWHLERKPQQAGELGIELWLAPDLGYLPVRLRLVQDKGDSIEQRLSRH